VVTPSDVIEIYDKYAWNGTIPLAVFDLLVRIVNAAPDSFDCRDTMGLGVAYSSKWIPATW
jgi:hypothetical protein